MFTAPEIVLAALLSISAATDLWRGLIYNWVSLPAALLGLGLGWWAGGPWGLLLAGAGLVVGGAIFLPPYLLGAMGGGDVKLMAAVGSLAGPVFALKTAAYGCLLGGLWALALMTLGGRLGPGLANLWRLVRGLVVSGLKPEPPRDLGLPGIPMAVCLAGGAVWARFFDLWPGLGAR
ncbi:MAG: A24 family peptidase [Desulfarculus sp.]|nr:A24 family peptidase [Desulfarculus sp.]